ncbi:phosphate starvation-inducible protein (PhoH-like) [Moraxella macacae 0408225]|uniref:PhoH-like protein n=1 Tax=Moraxella macacae 0408225 TaxID=1230338 RepID=L2F6W2_9GAMM|nr:PhoH family protein [Moraxella macacae]ELA08625.1 phosphate starvation-inducible protein (PhoH-like) [Moraxella macacae 0408225]
MSDIISQTLDFNELSPKIFKALLGEYNTHLNYISDRLNLNIQQHKNSLVLSGDILAVKRGQQVLEQMLSELKTTDCLSPETLHILIQTSGITKPINDTQTTSNFTPISLKTRKGNITPRGYNQQQYVKKILLSDVSFGVGPAGTGKTYLAVACAVDMLERHEIERILLVRPAVEAGEKLGFLPGDLSQKIDPYLRPLYDALYEMLGFEKVGKLLERQIIEVAPLAYMRGRTLNNSFVILDEAQNTTPEQMKMFLTRLGFGSRAVITGDMSQVDLPRGTQSGLYQALQILSGIDEIHITKFDSKDVVRHQLVQKIVQAYDKFDAEQEALKHAKKTRTFDQTYFGTKR